MLQEIYQEVVGTRAVRFLPSSDFDSLDEFQTTYEEQACPVLVQISEDQLADVMCWLSDDDDICFDTDSPSLINRRMQKLSCEEISALDSLTNIPNRATMARVIKAIAKQHADTDLSVLLCDMDHLKVLNDAEGTDAGDMAIRSLTDVLRDAVAETEILARVGGNRFAILSERTGTELERLGEELRRCVESHFENESNLTISVGAATGPASKCLGSTMPQADEAMYIAKAAGRNRYLHFEELKPISDRANADPEVKTDEQRVKVLSERVAEYVAMRKHLQLANEQTKKEHAELSHTRRFRDRIGEYSDSEGYLSLAFVEVDHFHYVSRKCGKDEGERVFNQVCNLVRSRVRETDWIGRFGGKEFCIVMPKTTLDGAYKILERLREHVENAEIVSAATGDIEEITLSIGAIESIGNETHRELLERAAAMALKATTSGRNRVCV